jgi:hypothetical protein
LAAAPAVRGLFRGQRGGLASPGAGWGTGGCAGAQQRSVDTGGMTQQLQHTPNPPRDNCDRSKQPRNGLKHYVRVPGAFSPGVEAPACRTSRIGGPGLEIATKSTKAY